MTQTPPIVDPSPYAAPIALNNQSLSELMAAYPAEASDAETLARQPNRAADATSGPTEQILQTLYVHMTKPNGSDVLVPKANVEHYVNKGYTVGAEEDIPDLPAYWAEKAAVAPTAPEPPPEPTP